MTQDQQKVGGPWMLHSLKALLGLRLRATCFLSGEKGCQVLSLASAFKQTDAARMSYLFVT